MGGGGGVGFGGRIGGQGRCEQRSERRVGSGSFGRGGGGQGVCERQIEVFVKLKKKSLGGGGGGSGWGGVRMDVNEELKFL